MKKTMPVPKQTTTVDDKQFDLAVLVLYGLPASVLMLGAVLGGVVGRMIPGAPALWSALVGGSLFALAFWTIRRTMAKKD